MAHEVMDKGKEIRECALIGAAVLHAQKIEFALYGAVSHIVGLPQSHEKRFRNLDPEKFLRGDVKDLKVTLGQLVKSFGHKLLLTTEELEKFIEDRNLIVHNYWRLTKTDIKGAERLLDPEEFLIEFAEKCNHWEQVLRGLIALMRRQTAKKQGKEKELNLTKEDLVYIEYYERNAVKHLTQTSQNSTIPS